MDDSLLAATVSSLQAATVDEVRSTSTNEIDDTSFAATVSSRQAATFSRNKLQEYEAERQGSEREYEVGDGATVSSLQAGTFSRNKLQEYNAECHLYLGSEREHKAVEDKSVQQFEVHVPLPVKPPTPKAPTKQCCSQAPVHSCFGIPDIELEFVEEPPEMVWCEICARILREPQLPTCCGKSHLCIECIQAIQLKGNSHCPFCRKESFQTILSVDLRSIILNLQVWCPQKEEGCPWSGRIEESEKHLDEECPFYLLSCPNECGTAKFQRQYLRQHLDECPEQIIQCPFSKAGCSETVRRRVLRSHVEANLHLHLIQVSEKTIQLPVKYDNLARSLDTSYTAAQEQIDGKIAALRQQLASVQMVVSSLEMKLLDARKEIERLREEQVENSAKILANCDRQELLQPFQYLHEEINPQLQQLVIPCPSSKILPLILTLDKFKERQRVNDKWVSSPFYSHSGGYKMCLTIYPNGKNMSRGSHVSLHIHFMKGEYDHFLRWPFEGHITVLLLNQTGALMQLAAKATCGHYEKIFCLDTQASIHGRVRVTDAIGSYTSGWGYDKFISHEQLGEYLSGDCLRVKIVDVLFFPL